MRVIRLSITNFRSIKNVENLRIEPLQALVGENNAGKSNILRALACFLSSGTGGMGFSDFNDPTQTAIIEAEFGALSPSERKRLRSYLIGDRIILRKKLILQTDEKTGKKKIECEYHGYRAEPKDLHLSIAKIEAQSGPRPKWREIAEKSNILEYVKTGDDKVTKVSYEKGVEKYLQEHEETEYDVPQLGHTQALGIPQNLLTTLPQFYLLPAITDYADEIDRRSSTTVFRRLMADLADRLMRVDARYVDVENALRTLRDLLNPPMEGKESKRLDALGTVETTLRETINKLMPSVKAVRLDVKVEESNAIFSQGVSIKIDDGVLTDVLDKGHGLQRSIVFALLQMLMKSKAREKEVQPIILGIEEPELYIHPHTQRTIYGVLREFAGLRDDGEEAEGTDQVLYTTHCPTFIEVSRYERIGVVRKTPAEGTKVRQCERGVLGDPDDRKTFKLLTCFGLKHNELFFARECIVVEGIEDEIGIIATCRKLKRFVDLPDEIGLTIIVADGKGDIVKFQKVLNAFGFNYGVLLELDGKAEEDKQNAPILDNLNGKRCAKVPKRIEQLLGLDKHFNDQRQAKEFFSDYLHINREMEELVNALLPPLTD